MITLLRWKWANALALVLGLCMSSISCSGKNNEVPAVEEEEPEAPTLAAFEPYRSNRILIERGLQIFCWVATDNFDLAGPAGQPAFVMRPSDWTLTGFTAPTFYGPPLINTSFFDSFPDSQWAIAKGPYGDQLKRGPKDIEKRNGFLSDEQKKHMDRLFSICFGDEEDYSQNIVYYLKNWYAIARTYYPDVLVHSNQVINQWDANEMRSYVKTAKPDLITYDRYYFHTGDRDSYIGARDIAKDLNTYRVIAMEGTEGTGEDYIAFGQYIQGFVNQGTYKLSETQMRLYYFMTLAFGGKWLNWFRYLQGDGYGGSTSPTEWSLLFEMGMPGQPTVHMQWVNQCNKECLYLSDYIVRLKTKDVRYIAGTAGYTEGCPNNVDNFNPSVGYIKDIQGRFLENGKETEEGADLYMGVFDIIPAEEQGDPDFFENPDASFFMIVNGMASKMIQTAEELTQMITLTLDMSEMERKKLSWINLETGEKEELQGEINAGGEYVYKFPLKGATGTLLIVE